jgi:glycerophosphoryl diester phosphodiesterase
MRAARIHGTTIIRGMLPAIVAHRGDAEHFPENTLPALEAAWRHGIAHVEVDVHLSSDGVPFVIHDASLDRTTGSTGDVRFMHSGRLDGVDAGEPARFGRAHAGTALPRLSAVVARMADNPAARAFVEVKRGSLVHHGLAHCMERILAAVAPVRERCTIISFDADAVRHARAAGGMRIGWVLDGDPGQLRPVLELMQPEYVFCNHTRLAAGRPLPAGPWTWVIYEVTDADHARELAARGAAMVESMAPRRLAAALAAGGAAGA